MVEGREILPTVRSAERMTVRVPTGQPGRDQRGCVHLGDGFVGDLLFCPTVGPILSAGIPGIGLYSVLIFSSMVCDEVHGGCEHVSWRDLMV